MSLVSNEKGIMRKLALVIAMAFALSGGAYGTSTAQAHLVAKPTGKTMKSRLASQTENLAHARYVCKHGAREHKQWACKAEAWLKKELTKTQNAIAPPVPTGSPQSIICYVFGSACQAAIMVARCEGNFNPYAQNGQFLGTFQMGSWARSTYGHGYTIYEQAVAAKRYYDDSGWSGWQCSPYGGLQW